jgi:hypothetical protein
MLKHHLIQFIIMFLIGLTLNPMNILAYRITDLYLSKTLIYGALFMASNMIWVHEIVIALSFYKHNTFDLKVIIIGLLMSVITGLLLRSQLGVSDNDWLRRMIPHHSTALTTSTALLIKTTNPQIRELVSSIINTQEREISLMKSLLA